MHIISYRVCLELKCKHSIMLKILLLKFVNKSNKINVIVLQFRIIRAYLMNYNKFCIKV